MSSTNRGAFNAADLRFIADVLDEKNLPWENKINEYFAK